MTVSATTADGRARVLADGNQMPMLGLGIWQVPNRPATVNAVRWALDLGYRHIDTAQAYGNEQSVGKALRDSGLPRDRVFITTKFYRGRNDPAAEARQSLATTRRRPSSPVPFTGPRVVPSGRGRAWSGLASSGTPGPVGVSELQREAS